MNKPITILEKNQYFCDVAELKNNKIQVTWETIEFAVGDTMLGEEIKELGKAIQNNDKVEILDACLDVLVISTNILYKLTKIQEITKKEEMTIKINYFDLLDIIDRNSYEYFYDSKEEVCFEILTYLEALENAIIKKEVKLITNNIIEIFKLTVHLSLRILSIEKLFDSDCSKNIEKFILAFHEVLDSNLSKIKPDGTCDYSPEGKVLKPEGYFKPNLKQFLTTTK